MSSAKKAKSLVAGDIVETNEGEPFGEIEDIVFNPETQQPSFLITRLIENKDRLMLPVELFNKKKFRENKVQLDTTIEEAMKRSMMISGNTTMNFDQESQSWQIPLAEEHLQIEKKQIQLGEVLIHKTVEEVEQTIPATLTHDEVVIEHVPINQITLQPVGPRQEGDWLIIPVTKEVLVVQKQIIVVEEIRIYKQAVTEQQLFRETVRQERVEIENSSLKAQPKVNLQ